MTNLETDLHRRLSEMATSVRVEPDLDRIVDQTSVASVVQRPTRVSSRPRWIMVAGGLAAGALVVAALMLRVGEHDRRLGSETPTKDAYFPVVSNLPDGLEAPLHAGFGVPGNPPGFSLAQALIGHRDGDTISEYIVIGVATQDVDFSGVVGHVDTVAYDSTNSVQLLTQSRLSVGLSGNVTLETLETLLNVVAPTATADPLTFQVPPLPAGYELIAQTPAHLVSTVPVPELSTDESTSPPLTINVDFNPMPALASASNTPTQVRINGIDGWTWEDSRNPAFHTVAWTAGPGINIYVSGDLHVDQAVAIARDVRFTDETTWRTRYQMHDAPTGPTTTLTVSPPNTPP